MLVAKGNTQRLALKDDVVFLLGTQAETVVLTVAQREADRSTIGLHLVACQFAKNIR